MKLRQVIASDVTVSVVVHLSILALVLFCSDVHPFSPAPTESVAVEIVTPQEIAERPPEVAEKAEPAPSPTPLPDFPAIEKPAAAEAPAPQPSAPAQPQKQATPAVPRPAPKMAAAQPPAQPATPAPAYTPPQPDLSIKYHVLLGLPPDMSVNPSPSPPSSDKAKDDDKDNFDAPATKAAEIGSSVVAQFRRHLRTCSKLPGSLKTSDDVKVKLRVFMTPDGKLAADPLLIEASASMKGPLLMQGAISALWACQPYGMLPPDRYGEWKVLDLSFTPQDFSGGS